MKVFDGEFKKHVFICVNERDGTCCSKTGSKDVAAELKQWVKDQGLKCSVKVTKTKCMGYCNDVGATVVLHPEQKWFLQTKMEDLDKVKEAITK